jgi:uncharacterized alkaline shock family protein YloU
MTEVSTGAPRSYDPDETDVALTPIRDDDALGHVEPASSTTGALSTASTPSSAAAPSAAIPAQSAAPSLEDTNETPGSFRDSLSEAGDRATAFAGQAADRAGDYAHDAAEKAGDLAHTAAERAGEYAQSAATATKEFAGRTAERLRNNAELPGERGVTSIGDEVVEKIAGYAAREIEGVYDLGGDVARIFASVKERIGLGDKDEQSDRGVTVRLEGKNASIKIVIVIEYGYQVYTVTEQVRSKVIDKVEDLLGLEVTAVDILVDDIHIDESKLAATAKPLAK